MSRRRRWPWVVAAIVVVAAGGVAVAAANDEIQCHVPLVECLDRDSDGSTHGELFVRNDRAEEIALQANSSSIPVSPGQLRALGELGCDGKSLVATDAAGRELGRLSGDDACNVRTWIFKSDGTASLVPGRVAP